MTTPFSAYYDPSSLRAGDTDLIARSITVLSGASLASGALIEGVASTAPTTVLPRGTVLGRITASDKYIPSIATASDGSQIPSAILATPLDPSAGDTIGPAYFHGEFAGEKLSYDASWTAATIEKALRVAGTLIEIRTLGSLG